MRKFARSSLFTKGIVMVLAVCIAIAIPFAYSLSFAQDPVPGDPGLGDIATLAPGEGESPMVQMKTYLIVDGTPVPIDPMSTRIPGEMYIDEHPTLGVSVGMMPLPGSELANIDPKNLPAHLPMDAVLGSFLDSRKPLTETLIVNGPETAGVTVSINNQAVQLPSDFYIKHKIIGITCDAADPVCPNAPILVIAHATTGHYLGIDADGIAANGDVSADEFAQLLIEFEPILSQIEGAE